MALSCRTRTWAPVFASANPRAAALFFSPLHSSHSFTYPRERYTFDAVFFGLSPAQRPRRRSCVRLLALLALFMAAPSALATIARPTDFATMVKNADSIFLGKALSERSEWAVLNGRRAIVTFVSFEVEETFKGASSPTLELRLPGGTIGDKSFEMVGFPRFTLGERAILFIRTNQNLICPLVGIYHGKLTIKKDPASGEEILLRHNGKPLTTLEEIGKDEDQPEAQAQLTEPHGASNSGEPMKVQRFKEALRNELKAVPTK
jgi:hypothetical protein